MNEKSKELEEDMFKEEENSKVTIEERMEKKEESLAWDSQPTNDQGKDKSQSTCLEVWTPSQICGSPNEDEAMFTSSLQPYEDMDKKESTKFSDSSYMQDNGRKADADKDEAAR
ncbi:uncharacterized protein LOC131859526 [Cryptomeria japonica]|uniref:uncharacterized protein LOC131859526 n=1 Tax=Cryptomeria japonica TaxID=3369 RepID=UPI0027DA849B|nr:uncharacterized protein LOC131859526 [Cryptomeria japonica]